MHQSYVIENAYPQFAQVFAGGVFKKIFVLRA